MPTRAILSIKANATTAGLDIKVNDYTGHVGSLKL